MHGELSYQGGPPMNEYRGKHAPSTPWAVASTATVPMRHARHVRRSRRRRIATILVFLALLVMIVYPFMEARYLTVEKVVLQSDDLPANANHLRIVFLSDIHWGFWYRWLKSNACRRRRGHSYRNNNCLCR